MTEQVETLIEHIRDYYQQLAAYYHELAIDSRQSERVNLVLGHVQDYEGKRAAMLDAQLQEHPDYPNFLGTWLKEKPHEPNSALRLELEDPLPKASQYSVTDIMKLVSTQHNQIVTIYRQLAKLSNSESLKQFFGNLASNEEAELKVLIRAMQEIESL